MTRFEQLQRKMQQYEWLRSIADKYEQMINLINREKEYFTIQGFSYTARGDIERMEINSHRSIPCEYIRQGLEAALLGVKQEIADLEVDLKEWMEEEQDDIR